MKSCITRGENILSGLTKILARFVILLGLSIAVFLAVGFIRFSLTVANYHKVSPQKADGIVVLTGGRSRIATGLHLLQKNQAKRLLISGVNPDISNDAIFHRFTKYKPLLICCIDLDRRSQNTSQNAEEISNWVEKNNYYSLIVVTSDYHLPRALLELSLKSPQTTLFPVAATSTSPTRAAILSDAEHLRIMFKEFSKTFAVSLLALFASIGF